MCATPNSSRAWRWEPKPGPIIPASSAGVDVERRHGIYAHQGVKALEDWLSGQRVKNINAVNDAIKGATPWSMKWGAGA